MDWTDILGWGSPIGLGVFFAGVGFWLHSLTKMRTLNKQSAIKK